MNIGERLITDINDLKLLEYQSCSYHPFLLPFSSEVKLDTILYKQLSKKMNVTFWVNIRYDK